MPPRPMVQIALFEDASAVPLPTLPQDVRHQLQQQVVQWMRAIAVAQVQNNLESQRRQYALVERAGQLGWERVEVIDDDLCHSGSGTCARASNSC
ncbi:hypothetical protein LMG29542_08099 [Paraburkholderia humisilvae]|uniref:Uncharacterized protein n=1 Tax=Paraburkholderia humisilvae TaxID=627669 RepID=A0A6J5FA87_9BURK|nr:hypothetical protein LMG29542_08099 [Paraburkholderia humisilvae]